MSHNVKSWFHWEKTPNHVQTSQTALLSLFPVQKPIGYSQMLWLPALATFLAGSFQVTVMPPDPRIRHRDPPGSTCHSTACWCCSASRCSRTAPCDLGRFPGGGCGHKMGCSKQNGICGWSGTKWELYTMFGISISVLRPWKHCDSPMDSGEIMWLHNWQTHTVGGIGAKASEKFLAVPGWILGCHSQVQKNTTHAGVQSMPFFGDKCQ